jgi:hypothetical protein
LQPPLHGACAGAPPVVRSPASVFSTRASHP